MSGGNNYEPMLDMYIYETTMQLEELEIIIIQSEANNNYSTKDINDIFRIMHTLKGSSAMMMYNEISLVTHSVEDLFYFFRENSPDDLDFEKISNLILECVDFVRIEVLKIKNGDTPDGKSSDVREEINKILSEFKKTDSDIVPNIEDNKDQQYYISTNKEKVESADINYFSALIYFSDDSEMENIRAYAVVHNLIDYSNRVLHIPKDLVEDDNATNYIKENGFRIFIETTKSYNEILEVLNKTVYLRDLEIEILDDDTKFNESEKQREVFIEKEVEIKSSINNIAKEDFSNEIKSSSTDFVSVNVNQLDKLMDLVGEMVIAEAMVTQNPEVKLLNIESFNNASRQLHKITGDLQDLVMTTRMMALTTTFQKMRRIVRDMSKRLDKMVNLKLIGEETEVDKNIIENISDPLMHLIRNALDHGIESKEEREMTGKNIEGLITLEALNAGSEVFVIIKDDGKGLNKRAILDKAIKNNLLTKDENEMSDREIYNLILLPGFSTKDKVTEFSGRGVGMDVVAKNLLNIGGSINIDSSEGVGTTITLKIPLTLAIIDGMNIKVGESRFTIPTTSIQESFRPKTDEWFSDTDNNEMIMFRGECLPIVRIHDFYSLETSKVNFDEGILIVVEHEGMWTCLFADELLSQQQVVVKTLPNYIRNIKHIDTLSGCTLLGDGSISLIIDVGGFLN